MVHGVQSNIALRPFNTGRIAGDVHPGEAAYVSRFRSAGKGFVLDGLRVVPSPLPTKRVSPALVVQFRRAEKIAARVHHQSPFCAASDCKRFSCWAGSRPVLAGVAVEIL